MPSTVTPSQSTSALHLHRAPIPEEEPLPGEEPGPDDEEPPPHPDPSMPPCRPACAAADASLQNRLFH